MKSPLEVDKQTVKKYGITPELDVSPMQKLSFLQEQISQLQAMQWRARVDVVHATRLTESDNEVLKNKGYTNIAQHINEVQQSVGAIGMIQKMIEELRQEYPELQVQD